MTFPGRAMVQGTLTVPSTVSASVAAVANVNCGFQPSKVQIVNRTALLTMAGGPPVINPGANYLGFQWDWNVDFGSSLTNVLAMAPAASVANVPVVSNGILTGGSGITLFNGGAASPNQIVLGPKISGTNITKATGTFTVSSTATLFPGATVLVTNRATATQLAATDPSLGGMFFTINTIASGTTFTIANSGNWLNTASFTAGAENFNVQLVTTPSLYYPTNAQIVFISAANPMVITTSTNMNLTVGQQVRLKVPRYFAMTQADGLSGVVTAVSGNQVTIGSIDSSAFTAFSWNNGTAGTSAVPYIPATLIPIGSGPTVQPGPPTVTYNVDLLDDATDSQAFQGFTIGAGILIGKSTTVLGVTAGDVLSWTAWRQDA